MPIANNILLFLRNSERLNNLRPTLLTLDIILPLNPKNLFRLCVELTKRLLS